MHDVLIGALYAVFLVGVSIYAARELRRARTLPKAVDALRLRVERDDASDAEVNDE